MRPTIQLWAYHCVRTHVRTRFHCCVYGCNFILTILNFLSTLLFSSIRCYIRRAYTIFFGVSIWLSYSMLSSRSASKIFENVLWTCIATNTIAQAVRMQKFDVENETKKETNEKTIRTRQPFFTNGKHVNGKKITTQ